MTAPAKSLRAELREAVERLVDAECDSPELVGAASRVLDALLAQVPEEPVAWVLRTEGGFYLAADLDGWDFESNPSGAAQFTRAEAVTEASRISVPLDLVPVYLGEPEREEES